MQTDSAVSQMDLLCYVVLLRGKFGLVHDRLCTVLDIFSVLCDFLLYILKWWYVGPAASFSVKWLLYMLTQKQAIAHLGQTAARYFMEYW